MERSSSHFTVPFLSATRVFTLEEAKDLLPLIRRITQKANREMQVLATQLSYVRNQEKSKEYEKLAYEVFRLWGEKIKRLGVKGKGIWLVDFDMGKGYYCWKWPEKDLEYFHSYESGFEGRQKISDGLPQ